MLQVVASRRSARLVWILFVFALVSGCGSEPGENTAESATPVDPHRERVLVIVAQHPASALAEIETLVAWLNARWREEGTAISVRAVGSIPEAADWLRTGRADFFLDSPHPVLLARHWSGCRPILRFWKYGQPFYDSAFFARKDSGIRRVEDLRGQRIGFEDRYSSSSFFLPMGYLLGRGIEGFLLHRPEDPVPGDRPGWLFTGGDSNTVHWVLAGKIEAGAMNTYNLDRFSGDRREELRIFETTERIPRGLFAVRDDLGPEAERQIRELLLGAAEEPEGKEALAAFAGTTRFDEIPEDFQQTLDAAQAAVVHLDQVVEAGLSDASRP